VRSDPERRKRIKRGQPVAFRLTRQERDLIVERTLVDAEIEGRLRNARSNGSDLTVDLTLDDVDDLAGHVAAEANHCSEARVRRALDAVHDRLANIEDTFTDEDDQSADVVTHAEARSVSRVHLLLHEDSRPRAGRSGSSAVFLRHAACRAPDDRDARGARIHRPRTGNRALDQASTDASAAARSRIGSRNREFGMDEYSDIWIEQ